VRSGEVVEALPFGKFLFKVDVAFVSVVGMNGIVEAVI
jgi:hypothetical protein